MQGETPPWYVLTGAPSAGKSSLIAELAKRGYHTVEEAARHIIGQRMAAGETLEQIRGNSSTFQHAVLQLKLDWEAEMDREQVTFLDRGIPDSIAYYRHERIPQDDGISIAVANASYRRIFVLSLISKENFIADGEGTETWEGACELDRLLEDSYLSLGFDVVRVPPIPVPERADFVIKHLDQS